MKDQTHILFDLDGTLTDPAPGITNSIMFALKKAGMHVGPREEYYKFIGPPLVDSFCRFCGADHDTALLLLKYYREYFSVTGLFENAMFPGIPDMLDKLKNAGYTLAVATSKPEGFSCRILEHFGIFDRFAFVAGSTLDESRSTKAEVITWALENLGIAPDRAVMVGDREHDILGARQQHLGKSVGVLFGYGSRNELESAGADFIAADIDELTAVLL